MQSNYKPLENYIREVNVRNTELKVDKLMGVSIQKELMPSIANTVGTNMRTYKILKKRQFAYGPVTSRNGDKISVALLEDYDEVIISQAYTSFEIINIDKLLPEYLMMWFRRPEFDRYARFMSHGSAREVFGWEELCNTKLPIPSIETQCAIVAEYNTVKKRIALNNQLIQKLEETAQAIYKQWFVDFEFPFDFAQGKPDKNGKPYKSSGGEMVFNKELEREIPEGWKNSTLGEICSLITDGKHGDCTNKENSGYYFISVKDLADGEINYENARQITKEDFEETHRRTNLTMGDVLLTNAGTIGKLVIIKDRPETFRTTFQKSVAILKPQTEMVTTYFLYSLLNYCISEIKDLAGGSTQSNLLLGDLRDFQFIYPNFTSIELFEQIISSMFKSIELKGNENRNLQLMKMTLLSKLATIEN